MVQKDPTKTPVKDDEVKAAVSPKAVESKIEAHKAEQEREAEIAAGLRANDIKRLKGDVRTDDSTLETQAKLENIRISDELAREEFRRQEFLRVEAVRKEIEELDKKRDELISQVKGGAKFSNPEHDILVLHTAYRGERSGDTIINPGSYHKDDPYLLGLADWLVQVGKADWED